jgi:hypothetical protein
VVKLLWGSTLIKHTSSNVDYMILERGNRKRS